jgi:alkanesulfonate monooxygenase SsuD/methylene tetrahydromethanopterin reductase-like flavin-dependent oxidoreductase (luciferase family)
MSAVEQAMIGEALSCSAVGSPETVRREPAAFIDWTQADELIIASQIHDHQAQLRSYEITAAARDTLAAEEKRSEAAR